jgi:hypothetical protein
MEKIQTENISAWILRAEQKKLEKESGQQENGRRNE